MQVGNDQENAQSERNFHSESRRGKNYIDNYVLINRAFLFRYGPNYHLRIEIDLVRIRVAEALNMFDQL